VTADGLAALHDDAVWVDARRREVIAAVGADRVRLLNGLITNDVAAVPPGAGCRAALLTAKGHVAADLRLFVDADDIKIVVDAGQAAPTAATLERYAIMDDFHARHDADMVLGGVFGPRAVDRLTKVGLPHDVMASLEARGPLAHAVVAPNIWMARMRELGTGGFWIGGPPEVVEDLERRLAAAAGVARLDPDGAEAARIAAGEPRWSAEITADYFPMEVGLGDAIDYAKGCYLGQEVIVRIRDRGHINWQLRRLRLRGDSDPAPGDAVESEGRPRAGRITSAARLPGGEGVALALLHTSVAEGAEVRIKHGEATIPAVVSAQSGLDAGVDQR